MCLVLDGFGKSYGITGWRLGFAHGPKQLIEEMAKLQQFTFVCAPSPAQHAGVAALDFDVSPIVADYKRKRDLLCDSLRGTLRIRPARRSVLSLSQVPRGERRPTSLTRRSGNNLLVIPGIAFSRKDSHFRVSFAASDEKLMSGAGDPQPDGTAMRYAQARQTMPEGP